MKSSPKTRPASRRPARGFALIAILAVLGIVAVSLMVTALNSGALKNEQDRKTTYVLAQAKQALVGRAAADANRPGSLPCPDTDNDGIVTVGVDVIGNACASYIGRLPWKTLGLPDLRDSDGERLWYALSPNFRDATGVAINSGTIGTLYVTGSVTANNAAAVVFAPGAPLGQSRTTANANNVASYLDGNNAKAVGTYESLAPSGTFNDRLIAIVPAEVMSLVERRLAKEISDAVNGYFTSNALLPYAAPAECSGSCTAANGTLTGRIPGDPSPAPAYAGASAFLAAASGSWFDSNGWRNVVQYSVATECTVASPPCAPSAFNLASPTTVAPSAGGGQTTTSSTTGEGGSTAPKVTFSMSTGGYGASQLVFNLYSSNSSTTPQ